MADDDHDRQFDFENPLSLVSTLFLFFYLLTYLSL